MIMALRALTGGVRQTGLATRESSRSGPVPPGGDPGLRQRPSAAALYCATTVAGMRPRLNGDALLLHPRPDLAGALTARHGTRPGGCPARLAGRSMKRASCLWSVVSAVLAITAS